VEILVMAKEPIAGSVKTRLCPPCTPEEASRIAAAALCDTLDAAEASGYPVVVALAGNGDFLRGRDVRVVDQRGATFNDRLEHAWQELSHGGVQIAMDTPHITGDQLRAAALTVERDGAALGLAEDGGWWGLGLQRPLRGAFMGVPMSTSDTGASQRARLRALGVEPTLLPVLGDVDVWCDALRIARDAPTTAFARAVRVVASNLRSHA
jgi:glycosyltransferase A (GT-A) superfamily protein (DUF2064 family)